MGVGRRGGIKRDREIALGWLVVRGIKRKGKHPQWYRKNKRTMNRMLRDAIIDIAPLNTSRDQANVILETIFNTIVEKVILEGSATIPCFGRFYLRTVPGRWAPTNRAGYGTIDPKRKKWIPPRTYLAFTASEVLNICLRDEENPYASAS